MFALRITHRVLLWVGFAKSRYVRAVTIPEGFRRESVSLGEAEQVPMYVTALTAGEARTLRELLAQTAALLRHQDNKDPAITRLCPDIYPDDETASAELRDMTEQSLRESKVTAVTNALDTIPAEGGEVCLTSEEAHAWMRALTDIRLILGIRLGIDEDTDLVVELDEAVLADPVGPRVHSITIYHYLSVLQESLVSAVATELDDDLDM
jgi:hypothetical protein